mmetsp:Transcript_10102/g.15815  ORF Transcript_10102/g.15815 Transcript_10102/m.15815 type:complete len:142 (-) Transcript_10102:218-643(-)
MKTHDALIPTRFMCTISFLIATIMVFSTMHENILASLPAKYTDANWNQNRTSMIFALSVTVVSLTISLFGFMAGFSMFLPAANVINIISHSLGCIYTCVLIMEAWHFLTAWYVWAFFAAPVAVVELVIVIGTFTLGGINKV